jgi:uncharacterized protein YjiS (DUF1127 family)
VSLINNVQAPLAILLRAATAAGNVRRQFAAAKRERAISNAIGHMNDRQLQDLGLSRPHKSIPKHSYATAIAQLGMVR